VPMRGSRSIPVQYSIRFFNFTAGCGMAAFYPVIFNAAPPGAGRRRGPQQEGEAAS
jgi:hypothetical protein